MSPPVISLVTVYVSVAVIAPVCSGPAILNSNAIKHLLPGPGPEPGTPGHGGGHPASSQEEYVHVESGSLNLLIDPIQSPSCPADETCGRRGFCSATRGACLPCRRHRKRCARDAMCCPGNRCSNGVCRPVDSDMVQMFTVDEVASTVTSSSSSISNSVNINGQEPYSTMDPQTETAVTQELALMARALEGERCLRSSDCSDGLCCARHFWSKICKPVLREGQVCTKHRKKGALSLEIFQRCDCGEGLLCRTQRGLEEHRLNKAARSLHTCQRH